MTSENIRILERAMDDLQDFAAGTRYPQARADAFDIVADIQRLIEDIERMEREGRSKR
jgi:hypothetical protein